MTDLERRKLWVKAGGRCTLCKTYLLEGGLTYIEVAVGEGAHIVGQEKTSGSPRGLDDLATSQRDKAENILLACSSCHTEIDRWVSSRAIRRNLESDDDQLVGARGDAPFPYAADDLRRRKHARAVVLARDKTEETLGSGLRVGR